MNAPTKFRKIIVRTGTYFTDRRSVYRLWQCAGQWQLWPVSAVLGHPLIRISAQLIAKSAVSVLVNPGLVFAVGIPVVWQHGTKATPSADWAGNVCGVYQRHERHATTSGRTGAHGTDESRRADHGAGRSGAGDGRVRRDPDRRAFRYLYSKYSGVQFNGAMAIYSGHCFVAIVMLPVSMLLGVVMSELWPFAQHGISAMALAIKGSGPFGVAIYGFLERILVLTGLHHLVYTPFLYTELGGTRRCAVRFIRQRAAFYFGNGLPGGETAQQHGGMGYARHQQDVWPAGGAGDVHDRKAGA